MFSNVHKLLKMSTTYLKCPLSFLTSTNVRKFMNYSQMSTNVIKCSKNVRKCQETSKNIHKYDILNVLHLTKYPQRAENVQMSIYFWNIFDGPQMSQISTTLYVLKCPKMSISTNFLSLSQFSAYLL